MSGPRRIDELLAERATQGLGRSDAGELESLLESSPRADVDGFDLAAAALNLAMIPEVEPMPASVRARVLDRARRESILRGSIVDAAPSRSLASVADLAEERTRREPPASEPPAARTPWIPWLAAAAALALAVAGWWPRAEAPTGVEVAGPPPIEAVESAADAVRWAWTGTEDAAVGDAGEVGGEVVWSRAEQRGFMRISGLAVNDPNVEQYQLWIFDKARDERYPVDGGVFDVAADGDGEVLVPIDAKVGVDEAYLFAITVERPGGVVVSSRERIALLAQA